MGARLAPCFPVRKDNNNACLTGKQGAQGAGIQPGTSRALSENRTTGPSSHCNMAMTEASCDPNAKWICAPPYRHSSEYARLHIATPMLSGECTLRLGAWCVLPAQAGASHSRSAYSFGARVTRRTRGCLQFAAELLAMLYANNHTSHITSGLLRELNPGPLAPEARIIPLDQAAFAKFQLQFFYLRSEEDSTPLDWP